MKKFLQAFIALLVTFIAVSAFRWKEPGAPSLVDTWNERQCVRQGWKKVTGEIAGHHRQLFWKGPPHAWEYGAIIVMHGGGGNYTQWCYARRATSPVKPQVDFSNLAVSEGFGVFLLDSTDDVVTDAMGRPCGKRFDATIVETRKSNIDLPFIEHVLTKIIPSKRPPGSASDIFMTGESTGGFMTTRAATHFDSLMTAFAPVASADPYGTYFDCNPTLSPRTAAKGVGYDRETQQQIIERNACVSAAYPREQPWETQHPRKKPVVKTFHHEDDGVADLSCREKVGKLLAAHGYPDDGPFVIPSRGRRGVWAHLWQKEYNVPIIEFFKRHATQQE